MNAEQKLQQWEQFAERLRPLLREGRSGLRDLSARELQGLLDDYQRLTADLARARAMGAPRQTLEMLNRLVVMGHRVLYGYLPPESAETKTPAPHVRFAQEVWACRSHVLLASALFFGPMVIAYFAVQWHPALGYDLVPEGFYHFDPAHAENLHEIPSLTRPMVSSSIIANNIQVTLMAFGLGLTAGLGTSSVLVFNGVHIGVVAGWMALHGHSRALWGWIMPHGSTELLAIVISGAAGYLFAEALVAPGLQTRKAALRHAGRRALVLELGVMGMLVIAGLIEGFISPSSLPFEMRIGVLVISLTLWGVLFLGLGRHAASDAHLPTPDGGLTPMTSATPEKSSSSPA